MYRITNTNQIIGGMMNKQIKLRYVFFLIAITIAIVIPASIVLADEEDGYVYSGLKWNSNLVHYYHMDIDDYNIRSAITSAAYTWNAADSPHTMYYDGSTNNKWIWVELGDYLPALTFTYPSGGYIIKNITWMNEELEWSTDGTPSATEFDAETVAVHEFGHWLNLCDLEEEYNEDEVMYENINPQHVHRDLGSGDEDGIEYIYP
jgi:hypothetical protein